MKRYAKRYLKPEDWNLKNNFLVGTEWCVAGSKKGSEYIVTLEPKGFTCTCTGFTFHGKCKHSTDVMERFNV